MADLIEKSPILSKLTMCISQCESDWDDGYNTGIAEAMQYVKNAPAVNRWIPCSERLPEKHVEVLAYSPFWGKIVVAMWGGEYWLEQWTDDDLEQSEITHWMPLPEPPEKE